MHDANASLEWVSDADWETIDSTIIALAKKKGELDVEIGRWLLAAKREGVDRRCGYGTFAEYVERRLGYDARVTREKLRVARCLEKLPRMRALLASGERTWSALREIVRVATPEREDAWIEKTERMTVRQIETCVAGRKPGELPTDEKDPLLFPRRLVFDLLPEDFALVEEAFEKVRQEIGPAANKVEILRQMAEQVLGGRAATKPAYQTSLTVCVSCERTWQKAGGHVVEVSPESGECARCDGEIVGFTRIDEGIAELDADVNPTTTHVGYDLRAQRTGIDNQHVDFRALDPLTHLGHDGDDEVGLPHLGHQHDDEIRRLFGARRLLRLASKMFGVPLKSMTPRLRAAVRARDCGRCVVPGCENFRFVDLHHHRALAKGGPNTLENVYSLCTRHHRAVHEGLLSIEGSPSEGFVVRHAGGLLYGALVVTEPQDRQRSESAAA